MARRVPAAVATQRAGPGAQAWNRCKPPVSGSSDAPGGAQVTGAQVTGAQLTGAQLTGAQVIGALLAGALLIACGGQNAPEHPEVPAATQAAAKPPRDIVARSVHQFSGLDNADGTRLDAEALFTRLAAADVVCFGESHDDPRHHYAQLRTLNALLARAPAQGRHLAVGFEMFQAPFQAALDDYSAGKLDEAGLVSASEYEQRWGFEFSYYRPLLETARGKAGLLALNAQRETSRDIARGGMQALSSSQAHSLPELDLTDQQHRAVFDAAMAGHPVHPDMNLDHMYLAQVLWDETMAARVADYLEATPKAQVLVIAGLGHCHQSAIPARIQRRVPAAQVLSVRPRNASEQPEVSAAAPRYDLDWVIQTDGT